MIGHEHYTEAERLMRLAGSAATPAETMAYYAQVRATLALATAEVAAT